LASAFEAAVRGRRQGQKATTHEQTDFCWSPVAARRYLSRDLAASAISSAVTGRCGDIHGVWIEPVTAQVMITFRALMRTFLPLSNAWAS